MGGFHIYMGSGHFLGFKILNLTICWGFQKNEHFFIGLYLGVISMYFKVFS